jgi:hypothetical protein
VALQAALEVALPFLVVHCLPLQPGVALQVALGVALAFLVALPLKLQLPMHKLLCN